jgi:RNA polymerase sigma-70 factor, ECF subfamily
VANLDFEQLVEHFYMPLYRFALSLTREPSEAADLTQQTFLLWASKGHQLRQQGATQSPLVAGSGRQLSGSQLPGCGGAFTPLKLR